MGLGLGVFLIVLGLVVATGVASYDLGSVPDTTLGWLIFAAGLLMIAAGLMANQHHERGRHVEERAHRRR